MEILNMLMAGQWTIWHDYIKVPMLIVMAICAIFVILVVIFQPGNSSGISALGGQTETFLGKNKSKTFEHKMKKLTVVSSIIFAILCIAFAIITHFA
ncbi:MAG: preprotein translocase subunit SecG [Clostridiales bacterium]|nr:preprotein translocase subunit SecG [Clostridiales bacterium]